jgi:hypothetical protein
MTISSYAQHHCYTMIFITCASNFDFLYTFIINSVISRTSKCITILYTWCVQKETELGK